MSTQFQAYDPSLRAYLSEINATPLLSAEQERELAEHVAEGDPAARDHLTRANLRLVVRMAQGYSGRGLSLEDLIAEGNLGLMRAVEGFNAAAGVRFSTYAAYWIKQAIRGALMKQGRMVRLPAYMHTLLAKWRRASAMLKTQLGREPEPAEVGRALGLSPKKLQMAVKALHAQALTAVPQDSVGVDDNSPCDRIEAPGKSQEESLVEREEWAQLQTRLARLGSREATIVRLRYGLACESPQSLAEVGVRLGLTRERVRQLEKQTLASLAAG